MNIIIICAASVFLGLAIYLAVVAIYKGFVLLGTENAPDDEIKGTRDILISDCALWTVFYILNNLIT